MVFPAKGTELLNFQPLCHGFFVLHAGVVFALTLAAL
jgi:hypothetical protein